MTHPDAEMWVKVWRGAVRDGLFPTSVMRAQAQLAVAERDLEAVRARMARYNKENP